MKAILYAVIGIMAVAIAVLMYEWKTESRDHAEKIDKQASTIQNLEKKLESANDAVAAEKKRGDEWQASSADLAEKYVNQKWAKQDLEIYYEKIVPLLEKKAYAQGQYDVLAGKDSSIKMPEPKPSSIPGMPAGVERKAAQEPINLDK
jgi:CII-binding regulator of phage lambda lysogenization HflD